MNKVRCRQCKDYFNREDAYRNVGMGWVCTETCFHALNGRSRSERKALPRESKKRKAEKPLRAAVRAEVIERDGGRCVGPRRGLPGPCGRVGERGSLEVHEVASRGTHPGSHLQADLAVALCPFHHDMITSASGDMLALAHKVGLVVRPST